MASDWIAERMVARSIAKGDPMRSPFSSSPPGRTAEVGEVTMQSITGREVDEMASEIMLASRHVQMGASSPLRGRRR